MCDEKVSGGHTGATSSCSGLMIGSLANTKLSIVLSMGKKRHFQMTTDRRRQLTTGLLKVSKSTPTDLLCAMYRSRFYSALGALLFRAVEMSSHV